jgi:hypothetical protein
VRRCYEKQEAMTLWQILVVIGIIIIPLILSIWMTLWTVEKRGRGPSPYKRPEAQQPNPADEQTHSDGAADR